MNRPLRHGAIVLLLWGSGLTIWDLVTFGFIHAAFPTRRIEWEMLTSAASATLIAGAVVWWLDAHAAAEEPRVRLIADASVAGPTLAFGLGLMLVGAGFGLWLIAIGGGFALLGAGGVVREERARRRTLRRRGELG